MFKTLIDLLPSGRDAWVTQNVLDADERAALLRSLAEDEVAGFLDTPISGHAARMTIDSGLAEHLVGRRVGPFRVARLLGHDGMALQAEYSTRFQRAAALLELARNEGALREMLDVETQYPRWFRAVLCAWTCWRWRRVRCRVHSAPARTVAQQALAMRGTTLLEREVLSEL